MSGPGYPTPTPDYVNVFKTTYAIAINAQFNCRGVLKDLVTMNSDVNGISHEVPMFGGTTAYQRFGTELIQPTDIFTTKSFLSFVDLESPYQLGDIDSRQLIDESYRNSIVVGQVKALNSLMEKLVFNSFYNSYLNSSLSVPIETIKFSDFIPDNPSQMTKSFEVLGDGSERAGSTLAEADLKPFSYECLLSIGIIFDQMGIEMEDRVLMITPGMMRILLNEEKFISNLYVGPRTPVLEGITIYDYMGMKIIPAQINKFDNSLQVTNTLTYCGFKNSTIGTTKYVTAIAFTKSSMLLKTSGIQSKMWREDKNVADMYWSAIRCGSTLQIPNHVIQIPTTSIR